MEKLPKERVPQKEGWKLTVWEGRGAPLTSSHGDAAENNLQITTSARWLATAQKKLIYYKEYSLHSTVLNVLYSFHDNTRLDNVTHPAKITVAQFCNESALK